MKVSAMLVGVLLFSGCAAVTVSAQPRPGSFTTIITTGNITDGGLLFVAGFGNSLFSAGGTGPEQVTIRNTTAGTTNRGVLSLGNNISSGLVTLEAMSSTYVPSGAGVRQPNGSLLFSGGDGGLSIAVSNDTTGWIKFFSGSFSVVGERMRIHQSGGISIGGTTDPGLSNLLVDGGGMLKVTGVTFANLPSVVNGGMIWCSNCTPASSPCTGGSSGSMAFGQNSAWKCF